MNNLNTPKIGETILESGLEYIPEAHCYLKLNNQRIDITNYNSDWVFIPNIVSPPSKIQKLYYLQFSPKEVLL